MRKIFTAYVNVALLPRGGEWSLPRVCSRLQWGWVHFFEREKKTKLNHIKNGFKPKSFYGTSIIGSGPSLMRTNSTSRILWDCLFNGRVHFAAVWSTERSVNIVTFLWMKGQALYLSWTVPGSCSMDGKVNLKKGCIQFLDRYYVRNSWLGPFFILLSSVGQI